MTPTIMLAHRAMSLLLCCSKTHTPACLMHERPAIAHERHPFLAESGRAGIMIGAHRIRADKTGLTGLGAKNGTRRIESSKTVRVGFALRKTGPTVVDDGVARTTMLRFLIFVECARILHVEQGVVVVLAFVARAGWRSVLRSQVGLEVDVVLEPDADRRRVVFGMRVWAGATRSRVPGLVELRLRDERLAKEE